MADYNEMKNDSIYQKLYKGMLDIKDIKELMQKNKISYLKDIYNYMIQNYRQTVNYFGKTYKEEDLILYLDTIIFYFQQNKIYVESIPFHRLWAELYKRHALYYNAHPQIEKILTNTTQHGASEWESLLPKDLFIKVHTKTKRNFNTAACSYNSYEKNEGWLSAPGRWLRE